MIIFIKQRKILIVKLQSIQQGLFKKHKDHAECRSLYAIIRGTVKEKKGV